MYEKISVFQVVGEGHPFNKEIEENEISRKNNMTLFFNYLGTSFLDFFGGNQVSG